LEFMPALLNWFKMNGTIAAVAHLLKSVRLGEGVGEEGIGLVVETILGIAGARDIGEDVRTVLSDALVGCVFELGERVKSQGAFDPGQWRLKGLVQFALIAQGTEWRAVCFQHLPGFLKLLDDGIDGSPSLAVLAKLIARVPAEDVSRVVLPSFRAMIDAVSGKLSTVKDPDIEALISISSIAHSADATRFTSDVAGLLNAGSFSGLSVVALYGFLTAANVPLRQFIPANSSEVIALVKRLAVVARTSFHTRALPAILHFILTAVGVVLEQPLGPPVDMKADLTTLLSGGDIERSLSYHKVERLCFLASHHPETETRLLAYDILIQLAQAFERENDEWENYEPSLQAFLRQFNTDLTVYTKKVLQNAVPVRTLLETDAPGAVAYLSRRIATNRQPWAIKAFREAFELAERSPFLLGICALLATPSIVKRMGSKAITAASVVDKVMATRHFSSLSFLHPDFVREALVRVDGTLGAVEALILGIEPAAVKPDLINLEVRAIVNFPGAAIVRCVAAIGRQLSEGPVPAPVPELVAIFRDYAANVGDTSTIEALCWLCLVALRVDGDLEFLRSVLPLATDLSSITPFLWRAFELAGASVLQEAAPFLPNAAAAVALESDDPVLRPLAIFTFQLSDPGHPLLFTAAKKRFGDAETASALIARVVRESPELGPEVMSLAEGLTARPPTRVLEALLPWQSTVPLPRFVHLAVALTPTLLPAGVSSSFWRSLLSNAELAPSIFLEVLSAGASSDIQELVCGLCPIPIDISPQLASVISARTTEWLAAWQIAKLTTLFRFVWRTEAWVSSTILVTAVAVQLPALALSRDARRYIRRMLPDTRLPTGPLDIVARVCGVPVELSVRREVLNLALRMIGDARTPETFAVLARIIIVLAASPNVYESTGAAEAAFTEFANWHAREEHADEFTENVSLLFDCAATFGQRLDSAFFEFLVVLGIASAGVGSPQISVAFSKLLSATVPFVLELPEALKKEVFLLIGKGDALFEVVAANFLRLADRGDPVAEFWLNVASGKAVLTADAKILETIMRALALGRELLMHQVIGVLYRTGKVKEEQRERFVEFVRFVAMSPEIDASLAVPLLNVTRVLLGQPSGKPGMPLPLFRAELSAVAKALTVRQS
jgi:hypothetical protein